MDFANWVAYWHIHTWHLSMQWEIEAMRENVITYLQSNFSAISKNLGQAVLAFQTVSLFTNNTNSAPTSPNAIKTFLHWPFCLKYMWVMLAQVVIAFVNIELFWQLRLVKTHYSSGFIWLYIVLFDNCALLKLIIPAGSLSTTSFWRLINVHLNHAPEIKVRF